MNRNTCNLFIDQDDVEEYLIEYRGNILEQMKNIDYACVFRVTSKLALLAVKGDRLEELRKNVPAIIFVNFRNMYVLEGTSVEDVSNINPIKINKYLNLTGRGVIIGIVDTGIDYTNREFLREDNTSRIEVIWDQTINLPNSNQNPDEVFTGTIFDNTKINEAIKAKLSGNDPYAIVPSKDEIGHGTQMASIAGARGYDEDVEGVANDCTFAIVKLKESKKFKKQLEDENIRNVPVYYLSSIIAGIEYLKNYALKVKKPMIILNSIGTSEHSHDSSDIFSRYLNRIASYRGLVFVAGCGNEGLAEGHASGYITGIGDVKEVELQVGESMKLLQFKVYVRRPNKMAIAVIAPSSESSEFMSSNLYKEKVIEYVLENTTLKIDFYNVDNFTGLQTFVLSFSNIKAGIWKIRLKGEYIVNGRFDIWMFSRKMLKGETSLTSPCTCGTITNPSTSRYSLTISNYNQNNITVYPKSGLATTSIEGFEIDVAAGGVDVKCIFLNNQRVYITGTSVSAAVATGAALLLFQWGIVEGNDPYMYSQTLKSYMLRGTYRRKNDIYPNIEWGYGILDLLGVFTNL
ncbi:S8 family peptidase [Clostridium sp. HCS.1]|uniref:S8 family peptidase n=1 Tax=Clostridium sp. HCS.1 TaxID=3238594 RepID=UPI003A0FDCBF